MQLDEYELTEMKIFNEVLKGVRDTIIDDLTEEQHHFELQITANQEENNITGKQIDLYCDDFLKL